MLVYVRAGSPSCAVQEHVGQAKKGCASLPKAALFGVVGPTSAQFFNFGGFQQRPQPQRGGGGFGGGWFGNDMFEPFQQHAPQPRWDRRRQTLPPVREDFSGETVPEGVCLWIRSQRLIYREVHAIRMTRRIRDLCAV